MRCSWNQFGTRPVEIPWKLWVVPPQFPISYPVPQPDRVRLPRQWVDPEDIVERRPLPTSRWTRGAPATSPVVLGDCRVNVLPHIKAEIKNVGKVLSSPSLPQRLDIWVAP